ncbi:MAG: hypothetical protein ACOX9C_04965 [Kiritimatiellia bacterium]|jgi:hypothetical protein
MKKPKPSRKATPAPAAPARDWNRFAWHHVRADVPPDWEVTAYSVEDRAGRLEFNTRRGLQGIVSWEPCKREPDRLTTMTTFLANNIIGRKDAKDLRATDVKTEDAGPFLVGWLDETRPTQALAYDAKSERLVRWVFEGHTSPAGRRDIIRPILESFDFNHDPDACEYRLHGIHARLPWDYQIEDIVVLPANVMMSFEALDSKRKAVFRRWGLAGMLLGRKDLADFYKPILRTLGIEVEASAPCHVSGCEARTLRFNAPREHHGDRFMRRRWFGGQAVVWHDREANRIYAFEQIGPEGSEALAFEDALPGRRLEGEG